MTINWRRRAGCGRIFIDILGVHAETVKPVQTLLEELETRTGVAWHYFFVEDCGTA
jgi:type 1 glutamine amidotransferase